MAEGSGDDQVGAEAARLSLERVRNRRRRDVLELDRVNIGTVTPSPGGARSGALRLANARAASARLRDPDGAGLSRRGLPGRIDPRQSAPPATW